jgi:pSer/pThr/pTyr-binding forkhead associated (FHA) protein
VNGYVTECVGRDSSQLYRLGTTRLRVGRAFDNDVVLTARAVSPHHLELFVDDAQCAWLTNLSEENGTWLRRKPVEGSVALASTPCVIELGASVIRVHANDAEVATTQRLRHSYE